MLYIAVRLRFSYFPSPPPPPPSFHFSFSFPPFPIPTLSQAQAIVYYKENVYIKHQDYTKGRRDSPRKTFMTDTALQSARFSPVNHTLFQEQAF